LNSQLHAHFPSQLWEANFAKSGFNSKTYQQRQFTCLFSGRSVLIRQSAAGLPRLSGTFANRPTKEYDVPFTPEYERDGRQQELTRPEALHRLATLLDMHWNRGTRPIGTRPDMVFWTNDDISRALGWTSIKDNTVRQRIRRCRNTEKPLRPGEGWFKGILISFFGKDTEALNDQARAQRDELIAVYLATKRRQTTAKRSKAQSDRRKPAEMTAATTGSGLSEDR
jgi:hypothetical protein